MDKRTAKEIVETANSLSYNFSVYENYSGRGMYGKSTTGIIFNDIPTMVEVVAITASSITYEQYKLDNEDISSEEFLESLEHLSIDSIGKDYILY